MRERFVDSDSPLHRKTYTITNQVFSVVGLILNRSHELSQQQSANYGPAWVKLEHALQKFQTIWVALVDGKVQNEGTKSEKNTCLVSF